jgi:hypothetical protein
VARQPRSVRGRNKRFWGPRALLWLFALAILLMGREQLNRFQRGGTEDDRRVIVKLLTSIVAIALVLMVLSGPASEIYERVTKPQDPQGAINDCDAATNNRDEDQDTKRSAASGRQGSDLGKKEQQSDRPGKKPGGKSQTLKNTITLNEPATLVPEEPEGLQSAFGRNRFAKPRNFYLKLTRGPLPERGTKITVNQRPLERQEVEGQIGARQYSATATVTSPKEITVLICIDSAKERIDPGTYMGGIRLEDPLIEDVTVPITVTLQHRRYIWWAVSFGMLVLLTGTFFVWASSRRDREAAATVGDFRDNWRDWLRGRTIAFALGTIGATSAFVATYWRNPAWGARAPEDWFSLLGAMFSAFTAGLTAGSAAGSRAPDKPEARAIEVTPTTREAS